VALEDAVPSVAEGQSGAGGRPRSRASPRSMAAAQSPRSGSANVIEEDFQRLLGVFEAERARVEGAERQMACERAAVQAEVQQLRQDTEEWCLAERKKIEAEWRRLEQLTERMRGFLSSESADVLEVSCSGQSLSVPRSVLCCAAGSRFGRLFDEEFTADMPRDGAGRLLLDFDPRCFRIVVEHLQNRRLNSNAPLPVVPSSLRGIMEPLAEAWGLAPFLLQNRLNLSHGTSLSVIGREVRSTHHGWQLISAQDPLPLSAPSYFEVRVLESPDPSSSLVVGVCGRILRASEAHTVVQQGSAMYNSACGVIGDCVESAEVIRQGFQLTAGSAFGVRRSPGAGSLEWYHDGELIGECRLKQEWLELPRALYPVVGLCDVGQAVEVDFRAAAPAAASSREPLAGSDEAPAGG